MINHALRSSNKPNSPTSLVPEFHAPVPAGAVFEPRLANGAQFLLFGTILLDGNGAILASASHNGFIATQPST